MVDLREGFVTWVWFSETWSIVQEKERGPASEFVGVNKEGHK